MSGRTMKGKYGKLLFAILMLALIAGMGYAAGSDYLSSIKLTAANSGGGQAALAPFASLPVNGGGSNLSGDGPVPVGNGVLAGVSHKNDVSPALRDVKPA